MDTITWGNVKRVERLYAQKRILDNVSPEPNSGCWLWTANVDPNGYGRHLLSYDTAPHVWRIRLAHRLSFEAFVGSIPEGIVLDHLCRVRCCVNPQHLDPVTQAENCLRGRRFDRRMLSEYCGKGHRYKNGRRCDVCERESRRKRNQRLAEFRELDRRFDAILKGKKQEYQQQLEEKRLPAEERIKRRKARWYQRRGKELERLRPRSANNRTHLHANFAVEYAAEAAIAFLAPLLDRGLVIVGPSMGGIELDVMDFCAVAHHD